MSDNQKLLRATDKQIASAFQGICETLELDNANISLALFAQGGPASFTVNLSQLGSDENVQRLLGRNSVVFKSLQLALPTLGNMSITVQRAEPFDTLQVNIPQRGAPEPYMQAAAIAAIDEHLHTYKPTPIPDALLGEPLTDFYRSRDEAVVRLEALNTNIIEQNEAYRRRLEEDLDSRRTDLESAHAAKQSELEEEYASKKEALELQRKDLDDRSARHARREQFGQLKKLIQSRSEKFGLTPSTVRKGGQLTFCSRFWWCRSA